MHVRFGGPAAAGLIRAAGKITRGKFCLWSGMPVQWRGPESRYFRDTDMKLLKTLA